MIIVKNYLKRKKIIEKNIFDKIWKEKNWGNEKRRMNGFFSKKWERRLMKKVLKSNLQKEEKGIK